jgi:hypothetical protein
VGRKRRAPWLAWLAILSIASLALAPTASAASSTINVTWPQLTSVNTVSGAVYGDDTVSGAVYNCQPADTSPCALTVTQGDSYAVWGTATSGSGSVYDAVYSAPLTAASSPTDVLLPTIDHVPTGITATGVAAPAGSPTTVSTTVYSGTYSSQGPVSDGTLVVLTPSAGLTLSASSGYGATVNGSVYAATVSNAVYFQLTAGQSGQITVTYPGGSPATIGTIPVNLLFSGGGGGGGGGPIGSSGTGVGPSGGTLTCPDGDLTADIPSGAVPFGETLTCSSSSTAPSGAPPLPPNMSALSDYFTMGGASLDHPVTATLTYNPSPLGGLSSNRISVFHDGMWQFQPTTVQSSSDTALVSLGGGETIAVLGDTQKFPDVTSSYWARSYIDTMLGTGIVIGFPDGTFRPDDSLTRAQFAKMLVLTMGLTPGNGSTPFTDVSPTDWFAPYVSAAYAAGLTDGVSPTSFAPQAIVTREQMATFLARALKLTGTTTLTFTDQASIDSWAVSGVQATVAAGYINGFPNGTFEPLGPTTRAQASKILALVIAKEAPSPGS